MGKIKPYTIATLLLIGILIKYIFKISLIESNYLPIWSDEFFYYMNAYSVYIHDSLKASLTLNGCGALLFGGDTHGFMYGLTHGKIAQIFGWSNLNIVLTNLILLALSCYSLSTLKNFNRLEKLLSIILVLSYPFGFLYAFTYMQGLIHVFIAILLSIQTLYLYDKTYQNHINKHLILFSSILIFASLYKPTWLLGFCLLIPLSKNRKQFLLFSGLSVIMFYASTLIIKYFYEFVPNFFNSALKTYSSEGFNAFLDTLISHVQTNYEHFTEVTFSVYSFIKISILIIGLTFTLLAILKKNRLYFAITLFFGANFLLLFVFADAHSWREIRYLSPLFYFSIPFIIKFLNPILKGGLITTCMIAFLSLNNSEMIEGRNQFNLDDIEITKRQILSKINNSSEKEIVIKFDYLPRNNSLDLLSLPVKSYFGQPIRYIVPYYQVKQVEPDYFLSKGNIIRLNKKKEI